MSDDIERFPTESGQGMYEQRKANWDAIQAYHTRQAELRRQEEARARLRGLFAQPGVKYVEQKKEAPKADRAQRRKYAKCKHKNVKKTERMDKVYLSCPDCGYTISRDTTAFDRA